MPSHAGPNIVRESNLVFALDTGDTSNSYRGEPTTNYQWNGGSEFTPSYSDWTGAPAPIDVTNTSNQGPIKGAKTWQFTKNGSSNQWHGWEWTYGGIWTGNAGDIWTTSYWYKTTNDAGLGGFSIGYFYKPDWSAPFNTSILANVNSIIADGQWHYNYTTTQFNENYSNAIIVDGPSWGYSTNPGILYINGLQWEKKNHSTQFAYGTRSVSGSLLPLLGNTSLDISTVSFDSNAQITFDGTDDTISINSYPAIELADNISIEYVYMRLSTDPVLDVIANKYHTVGWELFCQTSATFALAGRNGDGTYYATSNPAYTIQNNQYYHLVAIKDGFSWRLYVNGALYASLTANTIGTWSNNGILQIGGEGAGYYPNMKLPIFKIYNSALSADQVKQNYQQYKSRFNLS